MCWISKKIPRKRIAKKDIPVFKMVIRDSENFISVYKRYKYKKGETYSSEIGEVKQHPKWYEINEGLHSYSTTSCYIFMAKISSITQALVVYGKDNYYLDFISTCDRPVKLNCIIPKGSEYYLNEKGEYVSNQIKIINECVGLVKASQ